MGQDFHVLKCFSCHMFQVHIVKKVNKWNCKLCGTKQSIIKVYGEGSAKDCRLHVQKLNSLLQLQTQKSLDIPIADLNSIQELNHTATNRRKQSTSKWSEYMTNCDNINADDRDIQCNIRKKIKENSACRDQFKHNIEDMNFSQNNTNLDTFFKEPTDVVNSKCIDSSKSKPSCLRKYNITSCDKKIDFDESSKFSSNVIQLSNSSDSEKPLSPSTNLVNNLKQSDKVVHCTLFEVQISDEELNDILTI